MCILCQPPITAEKIISKLQRDCKFLPRKGMKGFLCSKGTNRNAKAMDKVIGHTQSANENQVPRAIVLTEYIEENPPVKLGQLSPVVSTSKVYLRSTPITF